MLPCTLNLRDLDWHQTHSGLQQIRPKSGAFATLHQILFLIDTSLLQPLARVSDWSGIDFPSRAHNLIDRIQEWGRFILSFAPVTLVLIFDPRQLNGSAAESSALLSPREHARVDVKKDLANVVLKLNRALASVMLPSPVRPCGIRSQRKTK